MKKTSKKPLALSRETVRALDSNQLAQGAGAAGINSGVLQTFCCPQSFFTCPESYHCTRTCPQ